MQLLQVKEFNQMKHQKWLRDIETWKSEDRYGIGGMPFRPMYVFQREDTREDRKNGWVVIQDNSYRWFKNKQLAKQFIEGENSNE
jgi:hypothetical protein